METIVSLCCIEEGTVGHTVAMQAEIAHTFVAKVMLAAVVTL